MHVENVIYPYHLRRQAQYQPAYTVVSALQSPPRRNTRFTTLKHTYPGLPNWVFSLSLLKKLAGSISNETKKQKPPATNHSLPGKIKPARPQQRRQQQKQR